MPEIQITDIAPGEQQFIAVNGVEVVPVARVTDEGTVTYEAIDAATVHPVTAGLVGAALVRAGQEGVTRRNALITAALDMKREEVIRELDIIPEPLEPDVQARESLWQKVKQWFT